MSRNDNLVRTIEIKDQNGRVIGTKEVVTYAGLLTLVHEGGVKAIDTALLQFPSEANDFTAVFSAEVLTDKGTFKSHGDANPQNVNHRIAPHIIRMAETRAKARALRDAVNIGVVSIEELGFEGNGDLEEPQPPATRGNPPVNGTTAEAGGHPAGGTNSQPRRSPPRSNTGRAAGSNGPHNGGGNGPTGQNGGPVYLMSDAQRRYLFRLLAGRGIEGDEAHNHLVELCGTQSLNDVTKAQASVVIDRLIKEAKESEEVTFP
jgi:hypothetical protein